MNKTQVDPGVKAQVGYTRSKPIGSSFFVNEPVISPLTKDDSKCQHNFQIALAGKEPCLVAQVEAVDDSNLANCIGDRDHTVSTYPLSWLSVRLGGFIYKSDF